MVDGRVLVVGGRGKRQSSEIYDPEANAWLSLSETKSPRAEHIAVALPDGGVLIAGGSGNIDTIEVYDPIEATWTEAGKMVLSRYRFSAAKLPDGRVALVGGQGRDKVLAESEAVIAPDAGRSVDDLLAAAAAARTEAAKMLANTTPTPRADPDPGAPARRDHRGRTGYRLP